jgi:hypothetical protein
MLARRSASLAQFWRLRTHLTDTRTLSGLSSTWKREVHIAYRCQAAFGLPKGQARIFGGVCGVNASQYTIDKYVCCGQKPTQRRPPRFYVPDDKLKAAEIGTTFQLNLEETHHALR